MADRSTEGSDRHQVTYTVGAGGASSINFLMPRRDYVQLQCMVFSKPIVIGVASAGLGLASYVCAAALRMQQLTPFMLQAGRNPLLPAYLPACPPPPRHPCLAGHANGCTDTQGHRWSLGPVAAAPCPCRARDAFARFFFEPPPPVATPAPRIA